MFVRRSLSIHLNNPQIRVTARICESVCRCCHWKQIVNKLRHFAVQVCKYTFYTDRDQRGGTRAKFKISQRRVIWIWTWVIPLRLSFCFSVSGFLDPVGIWIFIEKRVKNVPYYKKYFSKAAETGFLKLIFHKNTRDVFCCEVSKIQRNRQIVGSSKSFSRKAKADIRYNRLSLEFSSQ